VIAGCNSAPPASAPAPPTETVAQLTEATFYLPNMNKGMKILWGDWPNKVKKALLELEGVASVEDEWDRQIESEEDLDLLFVSYRPSDITIDQLMKTISEHGFTAEVKEEN
jgi:copper chaperone CopZ